MEDFVATCPYFTRKLGMCYNKRKSPSSLIQNFCGEVQPSKDQRALFSELPFASIMGNLPEITLQYLWIAVTFQRMEIKSSFQDSIYKLLYAPLCHAVSSSWFQLNLEIKKIHKRSCLCTPALSHFPRGSWEIKIVWFLLWELSIRERCPWDICLETSNTQCPVVRTGTTLNLST